MKVAICYVHPACNQDVYGPAARRFASTYIEHPPGNTDHDIWVCHNGACGRGPYQDKLFDPLPVNWFEHTNWGKDIGAFQVAAETIPCDLLVCFGSHIYFHRAGWLDRMIKALENNGPTIFGAWGFHVPRPHLRTTGFWLPPELMKAYPTQVSDGTRYEFEHGADSITLWCQKLGFEPMLVTWNGELKMADWRGVSRQESLFYDQWFDGRGG